MRMIRNYLLLIWACAIIGSCEEPYGKPFGKEKTAMCDSDKSGMKRILAGMLGLLLLVVLLFSTFYLALESDHDCCGEECHICATIEQCEAVLHVFHSCQVTQVSMAAGLLLLCLILVRVAAQTYARKTPGSQKVQLNN